MAQREIGLAAGEPPSQKGYTPSVFSLLPKVFERAGNFEKGSITGFFTVLVEGDDFNEPICDAARGILDGHLILSRDLAATGHYPAIDVLSSISRLANKVASKDETSAAQRLREALAVYQQSSDLIQLGAHVQGANPKLDQSIRLRPQLLDFLKQPAETHTSQEETTNRLLSLAKELA
jgi:flagellum-specific ATP synthase